MKINEENLKEDTKIFVIKLNTHYNPKSKNNIKPIVVETHNVISVNKKNQTYVYTQYLDKKEKTGCFYNNGLILNKGYFFTEAFDDFDEAMNTAKKILNNESLTLEILKILFDFWGLSEVDNNIELSKNPHIFIE